MQAARIELLSGAERRGAARMLVDAPSTLRGSDAAPIDVTVSDISRTGFRIEAEAHLEIGATVTLGLRGAGAPEALVIRRDRTGYGCSFILPLSRQQMAQAMGDTDVVFPIASPDRRAEERADDVRRWEVRTALVYVVGVFALLALVWLWATMRTAI